MSLKTVGKFVLSDFSKNPKGCSQLKRARRTDHAKLGYELAKLNSYFFFFNFFTLDIGILTAHHLLPSPVSGPPEILILGEFLGFVWPS